jgi:hypothetical protein
MKRFALLLFALASPAMAQVQIGAGGSVVIGTQGLPLTGGTLSGPLIGTSATFSGNVTGATISNANGVLLPATATGYHGTGGTKVQLADGTGATDDCAKFNPAGVLTTAGVPCGGGGGGGITAITGDVTASGTGSVAATLATVNGGPGACGDSTHVCQVTTNGKGLVTTQAAVALGSVVNAGTTGQIAYYASNGTAVTGSNTLPGGALVGTTDSQTLSNKIYIAVSATTSASITITGTNASYYNKDATAGAAVTYTLPAPAAGKQFCIKNSHNGTAADTGVLEFLVANTGTDSIIFNGSKSVSGNITSSGAPGDSACVVGISSTQWEAYTSVGTWTLN